MIVSHNLSKRFGKVVAVDSINFRILRGRVVGFLGPNGAGKTTTIRMIAGFLPPSSGSVSVDGLEVAERPREVRRRIGYLPESTPLYVEMRVIEYLRFRGRLFGVPRRQMAAAIDRVSKRCGLDAVKRRPIRHLSKGYRQRVGLAAALVHDPAVVILDEPTVGLDPVQIREVRSLIRDLSGEHTVLFSSHILSEVELICDDVIMIAGGRIQRQGAVAELRAAAGGGRRYVLETDAKDAAATIRGLPKIAGVESVRLDDGWCRLVILPADARTDPREAIAKSLQGGGATVRELRDETPTLEHLFMEFVKADASASAVEAGVS